MNDEERLAFLDRHVAAIAEHFQNVQILVSWQDDVEGCATKITRGVHRGAGDYYARVGLAREFIDDDQHRGQAREIARAVDRLRE